MLIRTFTLLWLLMVFLIASAYAQEEVTPPPAINLDSSAEFYDSILDNVSAYIDPTRKDTPEQVLAQPERFQPVETKYLDFGLTQARIWLKVDVTNATGRSGPWRIDYARQYIQSIDTYIVRPGRTPIRVLQHKQTDPFTARPIQSRLLTQDIDIAPGETITLLIGYTSNATTSLKVGIGTPSSVVGRHSVESSLNDVLNGALWAIVIVSLIMIPIIGCRIGLRFAAYIIAGFTYVLHADGYTFQHVFPNQPWLTEPLNLAFMLVMSFAALSFTRELFALKVHAPRFDRILRWISFTAGILAIVVIPLIEFRGLMIAAYSLVPICSFLQAATGVIAVRKGIAGAWPYLIGGSFVVLSFAYATIAHLVPGAFNLDATLDFGHMVLLIECFVFAAAIMLRVIELRNQRDAATQAEIDLTKEQLALSKSLQKSQADYAEARQSSQTHRKRLVAVSHDLQQPLASLKAGLERLRGKDETTLAQMYAAFDFLETLSMGQLKTGDQDTLGAVDTVPEQEQFQLSDVLNNVHAIYSPQATSKGLNFIYIPVVAKVKTDPVALLRTVSNLVSNAIKYTEAGDVIMQAISDGGDVVIEIKDSGPGMTDAVLDRVRQTYQTEAANGGTGLGLPLVEESSRAFGYKFNITSTPGTGTVCRLTLPVISD